MPVARKYATRTVSPKQSGQIQKIMNKRKEVQRLLADLRATLRSDTAEIDLTCPLHLDFIQTLARSASVPIRKALE